MFKEVVAHSDVVAIVSVRWFAVGVWGGETLPRAADALCRLIVVVEN